jgi:hypothetical protein
MALGSEASVAQLSVVLDRLTHVEALKAKANREGRQHRRLGAFGGIDGGRPAGTAAPPAEEEDDRASVEESATEVVDGPPAPLDVDSLQSKSKKELQEMLTKRGLPFSKTDSKPTLTSLLKATA